MPTSDLKIDPRELRHLGHLEKPDPETTGQGGGRRRRWIRYASRVRARVEPLAGREFWQAQGIEAQHTHKVKLRGIPGVTESHRFVVASQYGEEMALNITAVIDVENRGRVLLLMCSGEAA